MCEGGVQGLQPGSAIYLAVRLSTYLWIFRSSFFICETGITTVISKHLETDEKHQLPE